MVMSLGLTLIVGLRRIRLRILLRLRMLSLMRTWNRIRVVRRRLWRTRRMMMLLRIPRG
jgi:hypothetical protein